MRRRRIIVGGYPCEVVPRARDTLPLPPNRVTNSIRLGIFGRAQRDKKVHLCNLVCMNNHDHIHVVPKKPENLPKFYGELLKKSTDALRTLTGRRSLRLWEDRVTVAMLASVEDVIDRLVYLFCNPTKAGLSDSIDTYPGINSWKAFTTCEPSIDAKVEIEVFWHRVAELPYLGTNSLSKAEDEKLEKLLLLSKNKIKHTLVFEPFAWLKHFNVTDPVQIEVIRQRVIKEVREREAEYRALRIKNKRTVPSPEALRCRPFLVPHTPKKKERKIFIICSDSEKRVAWIGLFKKIDIHCIQCYELCKSSLAPPPKWPSGTFIPWLPPTQCYQS